MRSRMSAHAGIKNLKLNALVRLELCRPCLTPPYFSALSVSFLEPISPEFQLQLSTVLLPGAIADSVTKPVILRILRNAVFSVCPKPSSIRRSLVGRSPACTCNLQKVSAAKGGSEPAMCKEHRRATCICSKHVCGKCHVSMYVAAW